MDLWVMMSDTRGPVAWPGQLSGREHPTPSYSTVADRVSDRQTSFVIVALANDV